jgi:hypothetical protein
MGPTTVSTSLTNLSGACRITPHKQKNGHEAHFLIRPRQQVPGAPGD